MTHHNQTKELTTWFLRLVAGAVGMVRANTLLLISHHDVVEPHATLCALAAVTAH
jgi:hypothetical protein